jgi:hypothetical protein
MNGSKKKRKEANQHLGSSFDDFLRAEGIEADVTTAACRTVIAWLVADYMRQQKISKSHMAKMMNTSRAAVDRLLDPHGGGITINTLEKAAAIFGKRVRIDFADSEPARAA